MATDHRGNVLKSNHEPNSLEDKLRKRAHSAAYRTGGKVVYGDPLDFENSDNRPIYSLPDFDREMGPESSLVSTRLRRFAPTLHDPSIGEYVTMRKPTFTRAGANRVAARAAEHYVKKGYVE